MTTVRYLVVDPHHLSMQEDCLSVVDKFKYSSKALPIMCHFVAIKVDLELKTLSTLSKFQKL